MTTGSAFRRAFGLTWACDYHCPEMAAIGSATAAVPVANGLPAGHAAAGAAPVAVAAAGPIVVGVTAADSWPADPGADDPLSGSAAPDVTIRVGDVPAELPMPRTDLALCQLRKGTFLFDLDGAGRFVVRDGNEIVSTALSDEMRLFVLGLGATIVLHQRARALPLHASAVEIDGRAVLFAGYSGAGKSTLLAEFLRRGCRMLADDVTAVEAGAGIVAYPSFPQIKLWPDAARHTGIDLRGHPRIRPTLDKHAVLVPERFRREPAPVSLVYALTSQNRPGITFEPLALPEVYRLLLFRTAGLPFLEGLGLRAAHFAAVTALAPRLGAVRIRRPIAGGSVAELADAVERDLRHRAAASSHGAGQV